MDGRWKFLAPRPPASGVRLRTDPPTFSVIIAAYQAADVIGDAVASALGQTSPPHEIIICDDGSTDDLDSALADFGDRIVLLRQENRGEAGAKNTAARAASGEFVVILDADDAFEAERIEALGALARERPDLDILTTDAVLELDGVAQRRVYGDQHAFEVDDQRAAILRRNFVFGHAAVRRELLHDVGGFDESIRRTTDWDLWVRLIIGSDARVGLVAEPLARYRVRRESLSSDRVGMALGGLMTLEKARAMPGLSDAERASLARGIAEQRRRARERAARLAIVEGHRDVRRRSFALAATRGVPLGGRVKALVAALAPAMAQRRLRPGAPVWTGAGGIEVWTDERGSAPGSPADPE